MVNKKRGRKIRIAAGIFISLLGIFSGNAFAVTVLPDPTTIVDGLPIVRPFDDFLSYSAKLLIEWDNLFDVPWNGDDFNVATGTGTLDVLLMTPTHAPGDNDPINAGGMTFAFQDSLISSTGDHEVTFDGTWGYYQPPAANPNVVEGPVLVDTLLSYLQKAFGPEATIPVFTFDLNQTGAHPDILLSAVVRIIDPGCIDNSSPACDPANTANDTVIDEWALDDLFQPGNGLYDQNQPSLTEGEICVDGATQDFCVNNNLGSGKMDFLVFAPTMDLSLYSGQGYWFVGELHMGTTEEVCTPPEHGNGPPKCEPALGALDNGGEELFLSGGFTPFRPPDNPTIPEPGTFFLLASGLGLAAFGRKKLF